MAPRYHLDVDLVGPDGLQSISPHWVVAFARWANPITYSVTERKSITRDITFAYEERPVLVVDDLGDCVALSVTATKSSHVQQMSVVLKDSGVQYLNEILPGDWVIAHMVYDLNAARALSEKLAVGERVNHWQYGLKFLGRVQGVYKNIAAAPNGTPSSAYTVQCAFGTEFDTTLLYYPQMAGSDAIPVSLELFGDQVSEMIRGNESDERGALDVNKLIPKLLSVIFGTGAWASDPKFGSHEKLPENPNHAFIVPQTVCGWLGILDQGRGPTFADILRSLIGVHKYSDVANSTNETVAKSPGKLFWPDNAKLRDGTYRITTYDLLGSFPTEMVPPTTTTPWAFMSNYFNQPVNESVIGLRPDMDGYIYPFFVLRQTPYTSEAGAEFDPEVFRAEKTTEAVRNRGFVESVSADGSLTGVLSRTPAQRPTPYKRAPTFSRVPTTRFLELPRWVATRSMIRQASLGRSEMTRQNLVFVYGSGAGMGPNEADQFVNAGPVKDDIDIYRNGVKPYMPSINCFLRDLLTSEPDWRNIMADIVMGQHLTLNGTVMLGTGIRAPISPGDNFEFESIVYHIESLSHACAIGDNGERSFTTTLALSRGCVDRTAGKNTDERRAAQFLTDNDKAVEMATTKD